MSLVFDLEAAEGTFSAEFDRHREILRRMIEAGHQEAPYLTARIDMFPADQAAALATMSIINRGVSPKVLGKVVADHVAGLVQSIGDSLGPHADDVMDQFFTSMEQWELDPTDGSIIIHAIPGGRA